MRCPNCLEHDLQIEEKKHSCPQCGLQFTLIQGEQKSFIKQRTTNTSHYGMILDLKNKFKSLSSKLENVKITFK